MQTPNYLYPLQTKRTLQWTKSVVPGEKGAKRPRIVKPHAAAKKKILHGMIKAVNHRQRSARTRKIMAPWRRHNNNGRMPVDPMKAPDPVPGNAMHLSNQKTSYNYYQN